MANGPWQKECGLLRLRLLLGQQESQLLLVAPRSGANARLAAAVGRIGNAGRGAATGHVLQGVAVEYADERFQGLVEYRVELAPALL
jgi:hypothetical protein